MKKFKFLFLFFLLVASGQLLVANSVSAAEVEVYPGPGVVGTQANATSDGWTDNHLVGQSFTPQNINQVTKIKLTNFKLGTVSGNAGGIVSVALFQGEPTASTVNIGGRGTTQISPTGATLAKTSKIYIGGQIPNQFNDLCGLPDNSIVTYLLKQIQINNPDRPCPSKSEWLRMWNIFYVQASEGYPGWQDKRLEWVNGREDIDRWIDPNYLPDGFGGDSVFTWSIPLGADSNMFYNSPTTFKGPSWTTQTATWQGTDSADNYLEVTLPTHSLAPGQPYFLSIQQSHLDQNRGGEEGGYYEQGRYNCEGPNESSNIAIPGYTPGGTFCGKGNVFVAQIDTGNRYAGGRAYFNTYYYLASGYQPATGDLTHLKIWGNQAFPPTASIYGLTGANVGQTLNYFAGAADLDSNLTRGEIWVTKNDFTTWTSSCPGTISGGIWCNLAYKSLSLGSGTFSGSWTPSSPGSYYVVVNAFDSSGLRCTGNPQYSFNGGTIVNASWSDCTSNDYLTVIVAQPVIISTTSKVSATNNPNVVGGFQGTPSTSGRQLADGGANWYNYMTVTEQIDVSGATGNDIALAIAAFLYRFVPPLEERGLSLSDQLELVTLTADTGFVLAYAQHNTPNPTSSPIEGSSDNSRFLAGHYYVFYNGGWRDMGDPDDPTNPGERNFCIYSDGITDSSKLCDRRPGVSGKFSVVGKPEDPNDPNTKRVQTAGNSLTVKWDIYTWPSFGSKKLETYGFAQVKQSGGELRIMSIPF